MTQPQIRFRDWTCTLVRREYSNGRTALQLVDAEDGEPVATVTVNVPNVQLGEGEVLVKDYGENHGLAEALEAAGIVKPTGRVVTTGFTECKVCRLVEGV